MIDNVIAILNQKGGCGKSTLAGNLAGLAALSGWKVLLVELDAQGNLNRDLGTMDITDQGEELYRAVREHRPPVPLEAVRPGLDFIPGGPHTEQLHRELAVAPDGYPDYTRLESTLRPLAGDFDAVFIDTPPVEVTAQLAALTASRYVLCPVRPDLGSVDGITGLVKRMATVGRVQGVSPELLGVVVIGSPKRGTRMLADLHEEINRRADGSIHIYEPAIREAAATAKACRDHGLLAHELELASARQSRELEERHGKAWWARLSTEQRKALRKLPDSRGVAEDFQLLATAILDDLSRRQAVDR